MLLDQKRTKRLVQIVAILTSIAFVGTIFVVLGLIFFGGGGKSVEDQNLDDARSLVEREPRRPESWDELAAAHIAKQEYPQAVSAARRAVGLAPRNYTFLQTLVASQQQAGDTAGAIDSLQDFVGRVPNNAEAFLQLGQLATEAGRAATARLAYQTFLRLAPDDPVAADVRAQLQQLESGDTTPAPTGQ